MAKGSQLKKYRNRVSKLRRLHPGLSYEAARKKASQEFAKGGSGKKKVSGMTEKGRKRSRPSASRYVHAKVGSIPDTATQSQLKGKLIKSLEEQAAWALLARQTAKSAKDRKSAAKTAREVLRKLKAARSV